MTQTVVLFSSSAVSGMSQQASRGEERKLQHKNEGGMEGGRGAFLQTQDNKPVFLYLSLSLSGLSTPTQFKTLELKRRSEESLSASLRIHVTTVPYLTH